jgi:hypothetical protein
VGGGGVGGRRIVIPMPEAINFVDGRRQLHLLTLAFLITFANSQNSQLVKHCENGGFIVNRGRNIGNDIFINREINNECFCHGTGFYGPTCNINCPPYSSN